MSLLNWQLYYLPPGFSLGGRLWNDACVGVRACVCVHACVHLLVTQISPKLLQLQIFGKLIVPMNFHALEIFWGFMDLGLKISE